MDDLALHPQTRLHLQRFTQQPSHALLLLGPEGSGKRQLALSVTHTLLGLPQAADVLAYPYLKLVSPEADKVSIGIEAVRELQHFTALKLPGTANTQRFIIIPEAQGLTGEAQNALLKLLEEPPQDTTFVLTASSEQLLLPTIRSRVRPLPLHRPARTTLEQHFASQGHAAKDIQHAYFMSGGLPGLMSALLTENDHPLKEAAQIARQLLQASQFDRLCRVDELAKKRTETAQVLLVLRHMAQAALEQTTEANNKSDTSDTTRLRQWHKVLQASFEAERAYTVNAQAKLTLTNLMLSL